MASWPEVSGVLSGLVSYGSFFLVFASAYAIIVLGLNLQWGYTGLFNVGVAGFVAVGAYTSALLTTPEVAGRAGGFGLPVAVGWAGAMLMSGLAGLLVGAASLRLRHDYLAITTFGIAVTLQLIALNAQWLTGGPFGVQFIPKPLQGWLGTGLGWTLGYLLLCWRCWGSATPHWSAWFAAPGAAFCALSAKMKPQPLRWARVPSNSGCNPL